MDLSPPRRHREQFPFVGFLTFQGIPIHVENARDSERTGPWGSTYMHHHYGEIDGTRGADGEPVDVYVGEHDDSDLAVVIHQCRPSTGEYDEDKVMLGFPTVERAVAAYLGQYDTPEFYGGHTLVAVNDLVAYLNAKHPPAPTPAPPPTMRLPLFKSMMVKAVQKSRAVPIATLLSARRNLPHLWPQIEAALESGAIVASEHDGTEYLWKGA